MEYRTQQKEITELSEISVLASVVLTYAQPTEQGILINGSGIYALHELAKLIEKRRETNGLPPIALDNAELIKLLERDLLAGY